MYIPLYLLGNGLVKKNPLIAARQRIGKNVIAETNTQAKIELLDVSFSMPSVSYQRKADE
jgi:hypothetical protein